MDFFSNQMSSNLITKANIKGYYNRWSVYIQLQLMVSDSTRVTKSRNLTLHAICLLFVYSLHNMRAIDMIKQFLLSLIFNYKRVMNVYYF